MTFDIALNGLNAATTELNTISHNIANSATTGFKRSRAEFADVYTATQSSGTSNTGQGVRVSSIRQEFSAGDMSFTNRNLDLAIEGQGMFGLSEGGIMSYTRSGNFGLDREGYLVNTEGARLTGYGVNENDQIIPVITDLKIDYTDLSPNASTQIELAMNLDTNAIPPTAPFSLDDPDSYNFSTSVLVYDSLGSSEVASLQFRKDTDTSWTAYTHVGDVLIGQAEVNFATDGKLLGVNDTTGTTTFESNSYSPASGAEPMTLGFDFTEISQFDNPFGINRITQDGFAAGRLDGFDIDSTGVIFGRFSNGQAKNMGQVTLSNFANIGGLRQIGTTSWAETFNSGEPATGAPNTASLGSLQSGALEGSNVDITQELVAMIGAQRNFQANAQVISTGDTLTQTVINIRR